MTEKYFPFASGSGDAVTEDLWSMLARNFVADGVIQGALNGLQVYADSTGMQVKVKTGRAVVKGHMYNTDAEIVLPISVADPTNPRIDSVVVRVDWTANTISLVVLPGTPAANPAAPALTQVDVLSGQANPRWEMLLANVNVAANATTIATGNVTDARTFTGAPTDTPSAGATAQFDQSGDLSANNFNGKLKSYDIAQTAPTGSTIPVRNSDGSLLMTINDNILFNPDANLGMNGWVAASGSPWSALFGQKGAYFSSTNITVAGTNQTLLSSPFLCNAGDQFTVSGLLDVESMTAGQLYLGMYFYSDTGGGTYLSSTGGTHVAPYASWTRVADVYTAPANAKSAKVCVVMTSDALGTARVRQIKCEVGNIASAFTNNSTLNITQYGPTWIAPTLLNSWQVFDAGHTPGYYKDMFGYVHIRGTVRLGTLGQPIFTLPAGYRPAMIIETIAMCNTGSDTYSHMTVLQNGNVQASAGSTWLTLDDIPAFRAEQ